MVDLDSVRKGHLILSEQTGGPYDEHAFRKRFRRVRTAAAESLPAIAGKQFLDLRDTAVTRLALAGSTVAEIRAITGHTLASVRKVLEHYLALDELWRTPALRGSSSGWRRKGLRFSQLSKLLKKTDQGAREGRQHARQVDPRAAFPVATPMTAASRRASLDLFASVGRGEAYCRAAFVHFPFVEG